MTSHDSCNNLQPHQVCTSVPFFLTSLLIITSFSLFDHGHSNMDEVIFLCGFDLHFPYDS